MRIHIVQKGDTLWKIAKEYGISFEDLKRLNAHLANPDYIVPGMEIILPEKVNKEHKGGQKETHLPKETPTHIKPVKEGVKKEVQKPTPPPPVVTPPLAPMPMPEPQVIPIPFPMPMMPQQPMWTPQPVELNWHQQVVMPQMEQHVTQQAPPPVQPIQPQQPIAPPPQPMPLPMPMPQPQPIYIMPQVPHCMSCHQPVHHHMWWQPMPMPMQPQVEACTMSQQPTNCQMPNMNVSGMGDFLESTTSPFFHSHHQPMPSQCGVMPEMKMEPACGCQAPPMMPNWQMNPYQCQSQCPPPCPDGNPWMSPQYFPGGMMPYRW
ncbi:LysM peptidoglycan-binding domain-containing protein [Lysinibacillus piscis]|uniref:Morphogenetic protein associated with SpoVID n=1 Tax=Lysinibacillus piscis TaxID=2518931 RepID=A0ABQ5NJI7_9BACI|nr:LysM peptidoglycan-binding domain-containing protein [Lysinibacillus sp. KH24]GLC88448.1 hypothetical protein LYSBPC_15750 [Lysinibacillus sp. KH24]